MVNEQVLQKVEKLNNNSKKIGQPEGLVIPLMEHQKAMLYRCLSIEKKNKNNSFPFGIIADKAGAGKTAVLIGLVLSDRIIFGKSKTLVVVPQNIHSQWISEIKKFTKGKDEIRVKSYINYSDISEIYSRNFSSSLEKDDHELYITTPVFYETINNAFYKENSVKNVFRRVIFDEIDTSSSFLESIYSKNKILSDACRTSGIKGIHDYSKKVNERYIFNMSWFVSASFDNMIKFKVSNGSLKNNQDHTKYFTFLGETITEDNFLDSTCLCDSKFVEESNFKIEEFSQEKIICKDPFLDTMWGCMSPEHIDACNSMSWKRLNIPVINSERDMCYDSRDVIVKLAEFYRDKIGNIHDASEFIKAKISSNTEDESEENVKKHLENLRKEKKFYSELLYSYHTRVCGNCDNLEDISDIFSCIIKNISILPFCEENSKLFKFKNIIKENEGAKILVFSDVSGGFEIIKNEISEFSKIKFEELEGGTSDQISKQIDRYKNGDTSILFIDSSSQGCGINLENTDIIIMIHKTKEVLFNQIIGRAQRPHRKTKLRVYELLNENEVV